MSRSTPVYDSVIFDLDGTLLRGRLLILVDQRREGF